MIGERGLFEALAEIGYRLTEDRPDYVIIGETVHYDFEEVTKAIRLTLAGARLIATNPDNAGPSESGLIPRSAAPWPPWSARPPR